MGGMMDTIWEIIERQLHAVASEAAHEASIHTGTVMRAVSGAYGTGGIATDRNPHSDILVATEAYTKARNALVARAMEAIKGENEAIVTQLQAARNEQELEQYRAREMQRQQSNLTPLYRNAHEAGDQ